MVAEVLHEALDVGVTGVAAKSRTDNVMLFVLGTVHAMSFFHRGARAMAASSTLPWMQLLLRHRVLACAICGILVILGRRAHHANTLFARVPIEPDHDPSIPDFERMCN